MLSRKSRVSLGGKTCLLVTAHPDDAPRYFMPTLEAFGDKGVKVTVLCMSTGQKAGESTLTSEEICKRCRHINICGVELVDDSRLCYGKPWIAADVAEYVKSSVERIKPDVVLTFDEHGATGQENSVACHFGVKAYMSQSTSDALQAARDGVARSGDWEMPEIWLLRTVGVWRRHLGRLEECRWIGNMIVRPKDEVVYRWWRPWSAHQGACAARSTSFMRSLGHAISSHYVYVNTLVHVAG